MDKILETIQSVILPGNYSEQYQGTESPPQIRIRKARRDEFIEPGPFRAEHAKIALVFNPDTAEPFVCKCDVLPALENDWKAYEMFLCRSRTRGLFLYPVRLPSADGRCDQWSSSLRHHLINNVGKWIRIFSDGLGSAGYRCIVAPDLPDPAFWQTVSYNEALEKACEGVIIDSIDHHVVRVLHGRF